MHEVTNPAYLMPVNEKIALIEPMYQPPACRRWVFWKKDRADCILLVSDNANRRFMTYGSDACDVAARTGLMLEYHSMGGVDIPALSIAASLAQYAATIIRLQGGCVDFLY